LCSALLWSLTEFSFALELDRIARQEAISGVLWVTVIFASILGLNRSLAAERDQGNLDAMLLAPIDRPAVFIGKLVGNFLFSLLVGLALLPVMTALYNVNMIQPWVLLVLTLGTLGFSAIGTVLATMTVQTRTRESLLPIVLLPIALPVRQLRCLCSWLLFEPRRTSSVARLKMNGLPGRRFCWCWMSSI